MWVRNSFARIDKSRDSHFMFIVVLRRDSSFFIARTTTSTHKNVVVKVHFRGVFVRVNQLKDARFQLRCERHSQ